MDDNLNILDILNILYRAQMEAGRWGRVQQGVKCPRLQQVGPLPLSLMHMQQDTPDQVLPPSLDLAFIIHFIQLNFLSPTSLISKCG